jgi:uncharacterized protein (TIGR00255 family)
MIKSMTGYGKEEASIHDKQVLVELRSLNSKGLDLSVRMPGVYREKELSVRTLIAEKLERGKIDISVFVESSEGIKGTHINQEVVKNYYSQLKKIGNDIEADQPNLLEIIMRLPDVMKAEREEFDETEWKQILKTIGSAIQKMDVFRVKEGQSLENDLRMRIDLIHKALSKVATEDNSRITAIREKIRKAIEELVAKDKIDNNRFEQELIYYMEKLDITEEKVRLKTHLDFFLNTMTENASGKKLGFISQEIGREINTIGSKANDAGIQKIVVLMKDELEKIKEQLNNVL